MKKILTVIFSLFFFTALAPARAPAAPASAAADFYNAKTIKILVGFSPGNNTDVMARIFARYLAKQTNATVVVANDAGGGGLVLIRK